VKDIKTKSNSRQTNQIIAVFVLLGTKYMKLLSQALRVFL